MKRELEGILTRIGDQPSIKIEDGKTKLIYNLLDGLTGKKVRITVEEVPPPEEE
jgi:hypothetical protein